MDDDELVCTEEIHHHGGDDFGIGVNSTSNFEHTLAHLKNRIISKYKIVPKNHFIYFFREAEIKLNIWKLSEEEKGKLYKRLFKEVYLLHDFNFYSEEDIFF